MKRAFEAVVTRDGNLYIAYCPEVPGAIGQGHDAEEALASLREVIELTLDDGWEQDSSEGPT